MKKPFLLIMGGYHASRKTGDWKKCYSSYEEALSHIIVQTYSYYHAKNICYKFSEDNVNYNWYEIVDLREWTEK